jgi:hypothetical protein
MGLGILALTMPGLTIQVAGEQSEEILVDNETPAKTNELSGILKVEVLEPRGGTIHLFSDTTGCESEPSIQRTYDVDRCYNLNPHVTKEIKIITPAICDNGKRALFGAYQSSNCWGNMYTLKQISDGAVGQCSDASSLWSFAFVYDGLKEETGLFRPMAVFWLVIGLVLLGLGLAMSCLCCGGFVLVSGAFSLLIWGFWTLRKMIKVSLVVTSWSMRY